MNKDNSTKFKQTKIITFRFVLSIFVVTLITLSVSIGKTSLSSDIRGECNLRGVSYGTDTVKVYVATTGNYILWFHVEAPELISYNLLTENYNPILVTIDNKTCYKLGGSMNMPLDTWMWINYLDSNQSDTFRVHFYQGQHVLKIVGVKSSIDQIEILRPNCFPSSDTTCSAQHESITFNY